MFPDVMRHKGFLTAELITGVILLGVIFTGLAVTLNGFSAFNDLQWARQRCTAAAQAQLDSLTATGRPIEAQELQRLWPEVSLSVDRSPGTVPWQGLELVRVTAAAQPGPHQAVVRLARYIRLAPARAEGGQP